MSNETIYGIIIGLVVAAIIKIISLFYVKVLLPYFRQIQYQGVILSGKWDCHYNTNSTGTPNQRIEIKQSGNKLQGKIRLDFWADGSVANEELLFKGTIRGEKVFITFENNKKQNIAFGAYIFKVQDNGDTLSGKAISIEPTDLSIYSEKRVWKKSN